MSAEETNSIRIAAFPAGAAPAGSRVLSLRLPLLEASDRAGRRNRRRFQREGVIALNLVSSPGAGKTALLERTLEEFGPEAGCAVLVGDLETDRDARRLRGRGAPVAQITTGSACHLDAEMVARGATLVGLNGIRLLFIENVGNLVCPAGFDLGERSRVVLLSCAEGEDKPLKYPPIFKSADLVILSKIDAAAALGFDRAMALGHIRRIAPQARVIELSARSGEGMPEWYAYLRGLLREG